MAPAQPPLPACLYFPFQDDAGIHNSNLISESDVGFAAPLTTQRAGTITDCAFPRGGPASATGPSGTASAEVIVVWGSFRPVKLSHDCWAPSCRTDIPTST